MEKDFENQDLENAASTKVQLIVEQVNNSEISSIKQTVTQILVTINDPNSSAKNLKDIIEVDPPLTAKLIKLANSALYGFPKTMSEIQEAIVCRGFDTVRELALSQKVCVLFQNDEYIHVFTKRSLWKHSVAVAFHHDPFANGSDNARMPAVMFIANFAVQNKLAGFCDAPYQNRTLYQKCLLKYSLQEKAIDLILKDVVEEIIKMEKAGWF